MDINTKQQLVAFLEQYITDNKREQVQRNIANRTQHVVPILEDIYQTQNISAVLRTAECLGVQDVHIIEERNEYAIDPGIAKGAGKWLSLYRYGQSQGNNTAFCLQQLCEQGYQIVATSPHADYSIESLPIDQKIAIAFGTEVKGLTEYVLEQADMSVSIPMHGFTESFNIGVSAAISLYSLTNRIRSSSVDWQLSNEKTLDVKLLWLRRILKHAPELEQHFFNVIHA